MYMYQSTRSLLCVYIMYLTLVLVKTTTKIHIDKMHVHVNCTRTYPSYPTKEA